MQTFTEFQEQYWEKLNSPVNRDIKLDELVNGNFFPYAQHCHEATLALAFALSNTQRGIKYIVIAPHVPVQSGFKSEFPIITNYIVDIISLHKFFIYRSSIIVLGGYNLTVYFCAL